MLVRIIGGHGGVGPGFRATSYLIDGKLLIDAGSCATHLQNEEQLALENILISHAHLDHIKDLAFLCDNCFAQKPTPFEVWSNETILGAIKTHLLNDIIWPDFTKLPSQEKPTMRFNKIVAGEFIDLGAYRILPIHVNHQGNAMGFIVEKSGISLLFTQDTGPTEKIWEAGKAAKNLKAIFTEVSFPNELEKVARDSQHLTPQLLKNEIKKMPLNVPIFLGHLKPHFQAKIFEQVESLAEPRLSIMGMSDTNYQFR